MKVSLFAKTFPSGGLAEFPAAVLIQTPKVYGFQHWEVLLQHRFN